MIKCVHQNKLSKVELFSDQSCILVFLDWWNFTYKGNKYRANNMQVLKAFRKIHVTEKFFNACECNKFSISHNAFNQPLTIITWVMNIHIKHIFDISYWISKFLKKAIILYLEVLLLHSGYQWDEPSKLHHVAEGCQPVSVLLLDLLKPSMLHLL